MPFDQYFTARKRKPGLAERMSAIHRRGWPEASQFERKIKLEMRKSGEQEEWFHVLNVPMSASAGELEAWSQTNPDWEFRLRPD